MNDHHDHSRASRPSAGAESGGDSIRPPSMSRLSAQQRQQELKHDTNDGPVAVSHLLMRPQNKPSGKETNQAQSSASMDKCRPNPIFIITSAIFLALTNVGLQQQAVAINQTASFTRPAPTLPLPFGSTRFVYPRSSNRQLLNSHYRYDVLTAKDDEEEEKKRKKKLEEEEEASKETLGQLRDQLMEMRKKFEHQLALVASGRRQMALGSACLASKDCSSRVENSHCRLDDYTCACLANHVEYNSTTCLPSALLGFKCSIDSQCEQRVANSFCSSGTNGANSSSASRVEATASKDEQRACSCKSNFIAYRRDKCLPGSQLNEYCLSNEQCRLNDKHSYCQWRITNIYGTCKCPPNYKQLPFASPLAGPGGSTSAPTRCVPRLGDVCLDDDECLMGTPNSTCASSSSSYDSGPGWRSSQAGSAQRRCQCRRGFGAAANRLDCLPDPAGPPMDSRDKSELEESNFTTIVTFGHQPGSGAAVQSADSTRQPQYDLVQPTTPVISTTTTTTVPETSAGPAVNKTPIRVAPPLKTTAAAAAATTKGALLVSSLGKKCSSRAECRARDPHSDCIGGICECLKPSSRCAANSTGCHGDTFQCRNGQCISWYFVCDQFRNCADGSDEDECQWSECPPEAFQCSNGQCLARSKVCNNRADCSDGSDELNCHRNGSIGAAASERQQGIAGGPSDGAPPSTGWENSTATPGCHPKAFTCSDGQCLPAYVFCNAVQDCSDGSDERQQLCERKQQQNGSSSLVVRPDETTTAASATTTSASPKKTSAANTLAPTGRDKAASEPDSPLVKADRLDINKMLASLNRRPTLTTTTEGRIGHEPAQSARPSTTLSRRRSRLLTEPARRRQRLLGASDAPDAEAADCPAGSFTCANGKCRSTAILCSGVDGCGDNSDESRCEVCQCEAS